MSCRCSRFPTEDPNYRIIRRVPSRYLHYYFYLRDPAIGPLAMCVGIYLPFQTTYYLNGHNFIEIELRRQGVAFHKDDNAFLSISDPKALQAVADKPPGRRQGGLHLRRARHQTATGKLYSVLEKLDHGHHVLRIYCKNLVGRMDEKFSTFPLANSLFHHRPDESLKPTSKLETAYHRADRAIQHVLDLLAA